MKKQYTNPSLSCSSKRHYAAPLAFFSAATAGAAAAGLIAGAAAGGYAASKVMKSSYTEVKGKYLKVIED